MNASLPAVFLATVLQASLFADPAPLSLAGSPPTDFPNEPLLLAASLSPGFAAPGPRVARDPERWPVRELRPREPAAPAPKSSLKHVVFCFGPVFGNGSREVDPNYMPPPTATDGLARVSRGEPVRYTRLPSHTKETTWVGANGSQIRYMTRVTRRDDRLQARNEPAAEAEPASVEQIVAENRKELTKISWARTYRRYPALEREDSPERAAFELFLIEKQANNADAPAFDNPMWPETLAAAFMAEREKGRAEAADLARANALAGADAAPGVIR